MADINICDLADEILVHMCSFLTSVDIIAFAEVCVRFNELCCQRAVVRTLDFRHCYNLREPALKTFFKPRIRCSNIHTLNLNYCYWLSPAFLGTLSKLKNLKELHLLDCKVSLSLLKKIAGPLELIALSWTWHQPWPPQSVSSIQPSRCTQRSLQKDQDFEQLQNCLSHLRHLVLYLSFVMYSPDINSMLQFCPNLERLEMHQCRFEHLSHSERVARLLYDHYVPRTREVAPSLTKLKKLRIRILAPHESDFYDLVLSWIIPANSSWEELWLQIRGNEVLNHWGDQGKLTYNDLLSIDALSLSGTWSLEYRGVIEDRNREVALNILDHGGQLKCRKLSLDGMKINATTLHAVAEQCTLLERLSMKNCEFIGPPVDIVCGLKDITEHCQKLTHLNLARTNAYSSDEYACLVLANLTNLKSLSITTSMLVITTREGAINEPDRSHVAEHKSSLEGLEKNRRRGVQTTSTEAMLRDSCLWLLTEKCPNLTKLDIYQSKHNQISVHDKTLACILRWKRLQHLGLFSIKGIRHGSFLSDILEHCQALTTLKLKNLGPLSACIYIQPLMQGLKYAKSLKDLSIHQVNFNLTTYFCRGLETCSTLERLALFCPSEVAASGLRSPDVCHLVLSLPRLVVLYILLKASNAFCKDLMQKLLGLQVERPALSCVVSNEGKPFLQCPAVHIDEMLLTEVGKHKELGNREYCGYSCTF